MSVSGSKTPHLARPDVSRVYDSLRSAHVERFASMVPARVFFSGTRYDFDTSLRPGQSTLEPVGRLRVLARLATGRFRAVELNEPLMTERWADLLAQLLVLRAVGWFTRRPVRITAYCIDLTDPAEKVHARRRVPLTMARVWSGLVLRTLVAGFDGLAVGTPGTWELMARYVGPAALTKRGRLVPALPAPCGCPIGAERRRNEVLFVGAFIERKGILLLMRAWERARSFEGSTTLRLIGVGALLPLVLEWAADRPEVVVDVDPSREQIHAAYRRAQVVVLPSQRSGYWREQVGLPIVEALAHGCEVVTTDETGLAAWLTDHGHTVAPVTGGPDVLGAAIAQSLSRARDAAAITRDLPAEDGRIAADRWMLAG